MNHLERQYLIAANGLTENIPSRVFNEDEITNYLDLDPREPGYTDRFFSLTKYHLDRGNLAPDSKTGLTGSRTLRVTAKGQDEARRLADTPVTPDEFSDATAAGEAPLEIQESLQSFKRDHPDPARVAFIMMKFGETRAHKEITSAIKKTLAARGIEGVRADDKLYNDYLFPNILTYMHGCGLGVAVFESLQTDETNPNVALEVGYLFAMRKPVCLLKDNKLQTLQTDLVGRFYNPFDPRNSAVTISPVLNKWLSDKGLGSS